MTAACTAGNFKDAGMPTSTSAATLSEQITVTQSPMEQSHTAGFDVSPVTTKIGDRCNMFPVWTCMALQELGSTSPVMHHDDFVTAHWLWCCWLCRLTMNQAHIHLAAGLDARPRRCSRIHLHSRNYGREVRRRQRLLCQCALAAHRHLPGKL